MKQSSELVKVLYSKLGNKLGPKRQFRLRLMGEGCDERVAAEIRRDSTGIIESVELRR
jgi:hypothetical protein